MLWVPGSVAALLVFLALIGFRVKARRRAAVLGQARARLQHASRQDNSPPLSPTREVESTKESSPPDPASSEPVIQDEEVVTTSPALNAAASPTSPALLEESITSNPPKVTHTPSLSPGPESSGSAFLQLATAMKRGDTNLFLPLKDALVGLVKHGESKERDGWPEDVFVAFKSRVEAFEEIMTAAMTSNDHGANNILNYLRSVAEVIEKVWETAASMEPAPVEQDSHNARKFFITLTAMLEVFEFENKTAVGNRLSVVRERLESREPAGIVNHHALAIGNYNTNTNIVGTGNINNYNPITNIIFPGSKDPVVLNLAEKQKEAMKAIKSVLGDRFVHDAVYDTQPQDAGCMEGTRETVMSQLMTWVTNSLMNIFWLAGMAGTGKTSIVVTLCRMLWSDPRIILGGSFLCSRTTGSAARTEVRCVLPTLAASLATQVPEFALALAVELEENDRIAHKPVSNQTIALLKKPLATIAPSSRPIIFVIDALDECNDQRELHELLTALADFESDAKVKFILTSRPEMHIRGTPISNPEHNTILQLHTISEKEVSADIRRYIASTLRMVPSNTDWYTNNDVDALVRLSHGLFIFASTVLKYVLAREQIKGRKDRLQKVTSTAGGGSAATSSLDKVYEMIVRDASRSSNVDEEELGITQRVVACILAARSSLSVEALADLLDLETDDLRGSLEHLHSVVHIPTEDVVAGVRVLHASFGDYIVLRAATDVRIDASLGDRTLAEGCLHVMAKHLHFNISQSRSSYEPNSATRPDCITLSVEYACLQWTYHMSHLPDPSVLDNEINEIFRPRLLFWLEVASVLGRVGRAAAMLHIATSTVRLLELSHFLRDARTFIASSREAIEKSAPHIYISALSFAPKHSLVYKTFASLCDGIISVETFGIDRHGSRRVMTLTGHEGEVYSVAYSADSHLLASGGRDGTVRIWDTRTGEETMPPLRSGDDMVYSVAFASSGKIIASGHSSFGSSSVSGPGVVCIWSILTEQVVPQRLLGHSSRVSLVMFSPDDSVLASASWDCTVRLWRPETGENIAVLDHSHTYQVNAVAFSPNGQMLASCFQDNIRLWNVVTGKPVGEPLRSLTDGSKIAVGSFQSIQLWEPLTWRNIATLGGYRGKVSSVQFSSDGSCLMSAEDNGAICLRRLQPDAVVVLASGSDRYRTSSSHTAVLAPDGLYIASGSASGAIQILDAGDNQVTVQALQVYESAVTSVAVSPDGTVIVSGSGDGMVQVWDAQTGEPRLPPLLGHKGPVCSMAFSPDGRLITSCSTMDKGSVRLWDAQTGGVVGDAISWQQTNESTVTAPVFSSDARLLATGYRCQIAKTEEVVGKQESIGLPRKDSYVHVFEVSTGKPLILDPMRCKGLVRGIAFSWDDTILAAVTSEGWIHLWYLNTGQSVWEQQVYQSRPPVWPPMLIMTADMTLECCSFNRLDCVVFSPDASRVVSGGNDSIYVWDLGSRQLVLDLKHLSSFPNLVSFSPCGRYIVSNVSPGLDWRESRDKSTVCLWDVSAGAPVAIMRGHGYRVQSVVFTPDGQSIVSCSNDSTIRVWNTAAARSLSSADACDPIAALSSVRLDKGWVLGPKGELLLWVPEEYRDFIQVPPCTLLIGRHRIVVTAGDNGLHAGENWTACWRRTAPSL